MESIIKVIGHDGSEIIFPEEDEPYCRRSFVLPELVDAAFHYGYALIPIQPLATIESCSHKFVDVYSDPEIQLDRYLKTNIGLILGKTAMDKPHMFAWDTHNIYDPTQPSMTKLEDCGIAIEEFHILARIKQ